MAEEVQRAAASDRPFLRRGDIPTFSGIPPHLPAAPVFFFCQTTKHTHTPHTGARTHNDTRSHWCACARITITRTRRNSAAFRNEQRKNLPSLHIHRNHYRRGPTRTDLYVRTYVTIDGDLWRGYFYIFPSDPDGLSIRPYIYTSPLPRCSRILRAWSSLRGIFNCSERRRGGPVCFSKENVAVRCTREKCLKNVALNRRSMDAK